MKKMFRLHEDYLDLKAAALSPLTNIVYVTNSGSNIVSVIDGKTNDVVHLSNK